mmetsp:Transcript_18189/g.41162  ORF Transcript_18189/g.41162 Transcript_18189/m.41162 type:complete len:631 (-) Transcript_18189:2729-4621(-)
MAGSGDLLPSQLAGRSGGGMAKKPKSIKLSNGTWLLIVTLSSVASFYAGMGIAMNVASAHSKVACNLDQHQHQPRQSRNCDCEGTCLSAMAGDGKNGDLAKKLDDYFQSQCKLKIDEAIKGAQTRMGEAALPPSSSNKRFGRSMQHFVTGLASVNRKDMFQKYDFGVPMDPGAEREDILMLYDSKRAMPNSIDVVKEAENDGVIPHISAADATENCDVMKVLYIKNPDRSLRQCYALVGGQYEGYHLQKWMRLVGEGSKGKIEKSAPLRVTGRMTKSSGYDELLYPKPNHLAMHRKIMITYYTNYDFVRKELEKKLRQIAINNLVVVVTVNQGQAELLMNFVCSSRAKGFDLKNLIVFPSDDFSREIAEGLGLATFYNQQLMAAIPSQEAERYGDSTFALIMMAKVICVQLVVDLGYDVLFQDVDMVWLKDPRLYFESGSAGDFDVFFQDDGNRQERYTPYSANSGFYFIRNNERSKLLFRQMLTSGDLIFACRSHQQILIQLLAEHNSLSGLRVKVLSRDNDEFPSGFHYHMRKDFMKKLISGKTEPYIFHMCWTLNKDDKLKYMSQMGFWYVHDSCFPNKKASEISGDSMIGHCCSAEPLFECHYKDKASIKSCSSSPAKDGRGISWW